MKDNSILSITVANDQNDQPTIFLYLSAGMPQHPILKGVMIEFLDALDAAIEAFPVHFHHLGGALSKAEESSTALQAEETERAPKSGKPPQSTAMDKPPAESKARRDKNTKTNRPPSKSGSAKKTSTGKTTPSASANAARSKTSQSARKDTGPMFAPSPELAAIVGTAPLTRGDLARRLWDYIKRHDLQDAKDRRQINADAALKKVLGRDQVSMFEMNKLINQHIQHIK